MTVPLLPVSPVQARVAAALAESVAAWDESAVLVADAEAGAAVLDRAGHELSARGVRCIRARVAPSGGLGLQGLVAQVLGRADLDAPTDADLRAAFAALTEPGEGYDRVALLVEGAHGLLPSAWRYLQIVCRSGPKLRVVLAGRSDLVAALSDDEFADLRGRFTRRLDPTAAAADASPDSFLPAPELPALEQRPAATAGRRVGLGVVVGLGLAASLGVAAWMAGSGDPPALPAATRADASGPSGRPSDPGMPPARTTRWEDAPAPPGATEPAAARADPPRAEATPPTEPAVTAQGHADQGHAEAVAPTARNPDAATGVVPPPGQAARAPVWPAERDAASAPDAAAVEDAPVRRDTVSPPADAAPSAAITAGAAPTPERPAPPASPGRVSGAAASGAPASGGPVPETPAGTGVRPEPPEGAATARVEPPSPPDGHREGVHPEAIRPEGRSESFAREGGSVGRSESFVPGRGVAEGSGAPLGEARASPEEARAPKGAPGQAVAARPEGRRCRDLVIKAQLGENLSNAEKDFLRGGCRAR